MGTINMENGSLTDLLDTKRTDFDCLDFHCIVINYIRIIKLLWV